MYYGGMPGQQTIFINFVQACSVCGQPATKQTRPDNRLWCEAHFAEVKRAIDERNAKAGMATILEAIFAATRPDMRKKLYRALAAVWHPDAGGDAALMTALNAINEKLA